MFLSFFVLLLNIPSNVNLALWRLCASSRMANLRSVFHSFMAYATLRSVALLFGNHSHLNSLMALLTIISASSMEQLRCPPDAFRCPPPLK